MKEIPYSTSQFCPLSFKVEATNGIIPEHFTDTERLVLAWIDHGIPYRQIGRELHLCRMTVAAIAKKAGRPSRKAQEQHNSTQIASEISRLSEIGMEGKTIAASLGVTAQAISHRLIKMGLRLKIKEQEKRRTDLQKAIIADRLSRRVSVAIIADHLMVTRNFIRSHMRAIHIEPATYESECRHHAVQVQSPRMTLAMELVPRTWDDVLIQAGLATNFFSRYRAQPTPLQRIASRLAKPLGVAEPWLLGKGEPELRGIRMEHLAETRARAHQRIRQAIADDGRSLCLLSEASGLPAQILGKVCYSLRPYPYVMPLALTLGRSPTWLSGGDSQ